MTVSRRERRQFLRVKQKYKRSINWKRIKNEAKFLPIIWASVFLVIFSFKYFSVSNNNEIRNKVSSNSQATTAKVVDIAGGKGTHYATYEFYIKGAKLTGTTFHTYNGRVGDENCINYYKAAPSINIYCGEALLETLIKDVLEYTFLIVGFTVIGTLFLVPLLIWFKAITGDKKVLSEYTYRKINKA